MTQQPASGSGSAAEAPPTCYRHPDRETGIRCQRCGRPICPDCMRPASVGYQCPSCVKEGARSTRQGRTAYGGKRPSDLRITTYALIAVNVLVWLAVLATGGSGGALYRSLILLPESVRIGLGDGSVVVARGVSDGAWWEVLTANFLHVSPIHILLNMLFLYWIGPVIEAPIGRARMLVACLVTGLTSSASVMWLSAPNQATLGFSGIAMGLLGIFVVLALKVGGNRDVLVQMIGFQLVFNLLARDVVSWQAHLGGFVGGVLVGVALAYAPRAHRAVVQWVGVAAIGVLAVVAIALRAALLAA